MSRLDESLVTPIYVKTHEDMPWPKDSVFYLLTNDNLYLCRNHDYFRSSVPAPRWPTELADHQSELRIRYPKIPRDQLEVICGFFDHVWWQDGAESIALLAWDHIENRVRTIIPKQIAAVRRSYDGQLSPLSVKYQTPTTLPSHLNIFADIHSHCDMSAYASQVDVEDEASIAGLHIVVGRLQTEPPQFHVEAVVDEKRFKVEPNHVMEGYQERKRDFPAHWLDQVTVVDYATYCDLDFDDVADFQQDGSSGLKSKTPQTSIDHATSAQPQESSSDEGQLLETNGVDHPDKQEEATTEDLHNDQDEQHN